MKSVKTFALRVFFKKSVSDWMWLKRYFGWRSWSTNCHMWL